MKYYRTIIIFFILSFLTITTLFFLVNNFKKIEKENSLLKKQINFLNEQININEIEYSLLNNYDYLHNLHQIYFDSEVELNLSNKVIDISELDKKNLENLYTISMR